jgi:flavin reductase (DIM6/NTAB) family NADH-FMN oxidoreductase RutF
MSEQEQVALFKRAMRRVASTVNIITIRHDSRPMGMVATAVSSVTVDPPSLLICINRGSKMHPSISEVDEFCVNVLHTDQLQVAQAFADSRLRDSRFQFGAWALDDQCPPYLRDSQAKLRCRRMQSMVYGTHTIFIGVVNDIVVREDLSPLMYLDGDYARFAPLQGDAGGPLVMDSGTFDSW